MAGFTKLFGFGGGEEERNSLFSGGGVRPSGSGPGSNAVSNAAAAAAKPTRNEYTRLNQTPEKNVNLNQPKEQARVSKERRVLSASNLGIIFVYVMQIVYINNSAGMFLLCLCCNYVMSLYCSLCLACIAILQYIKNYFIFLPKSNIGL